MNSISEIMNKRQGITIPGCLKRINQENQWLINLFFMDHNCINLTHIENCIPGGQETNGQYC